MGTRNLILFSLFRYSLSSMPPPSMAKRANVQVMKRRGELSPPGSDDEDTRNEDRRALEVAEITFPGLAEGIQRWQKKKSRENTRRKEELARSILSGGLFPERPEGASSSLSGPEEDEPTPPIENYLQVSFCNFPLLLSTQVCCIHFLMEKKSQFKALVTPKKTSKKTAGSKWSSALQTISSTSMFARNADFGVGAFTKGRAPTTPLFPPRGATPDAPSSFFSPPA